MSNDLETLARRAVACSKWHWMPGMLAIGHNKERRILEVTDGEPYWYGDGYRFRLIDGFPDLSDPATVGCLLALVREAHRDPRMFVEAYSFLRDKWRCVGVSFSMHWIGPDEAEALVAALEAAP